MIFNFNEQKKTNYEKQTMFITKTQSPYCLLGFFSDEIHVSVFVSTFLFIIDILYIFPFVVVNFIAT